MTFKVGEMAKKALVEMEGIISVLVEFSTAMRRLGEVIHYIRDLRVRSEWDPERAQK